jgi:class 3 adenylate cyclase/CHASE2 domain-containing sensor protein
MKISLPLKFVIAFTAFFIGMAVSSTNALKKLDYSYLDWLMITEEIDAEPSTVVVAVDQYSLQLFGWPVDRSIYAGLIFTLHEAKAEKIGFDLFFTDRVDEKDPSMLERIVASEELLGLAGSETGAVFGSFVNYDSRRNPENKVNYPPTPVKTAVKCSCQGTETLPGKKSEFSYVEALVPGIAKLDPEVAHVHVIPSKVDRVNRSIVPCIPVYDGCIVDLSMAMLNVASDQKCCKEQVVPYFRSGDDFPVISMSEVIMASEDEESMKKLEDKVRGKYVVVGATDETLKDVGPTPFGEVEPLVFVHANRLEGLLNNIEIKMVPMIYFYLIPLVILVFMLIFINSLRYYLAASVLFVPLIYGASYFLFRSNYFFVYPFPAFSPFVLANVSIAGYLGWKYFLFNQVLSNAFDNYVSPEILNWLKDTGGQVLRSDSAERRSITILFSDIAGYTSLSNSLNAETIMKSLRLYLDAMMVETALHNGYVDKINGDGLMILFGAPKPFENHAKKALECAVSMQKKVIEIQKEWMEITNRELKIRIGIATDTVFVGNIGGTGHIEYSAIGRGVNFAARLESGSEIGGILVSEETIKQAGFRPDGYKRSVALKGYEGEVDVWQISPEKNKTDMDIEKLPEGSNV